MNNAHAHTISALGLLVVLGGLAGCSSPGSATDQTSSGGSALNSAAASDLAPDSQEEAEESSEWGYDLPLPFFQLPASRQQEYQNKLPLGAVGAVLTQQAPYRATATYLGQFSGEYLFSFADHVAIGSQPYAVEFGYDATSQNKFTVQLDTTALFTTANGDTVIYKAADGLDSGTAAKLQAITPVQVSFTPLSDLIQEHPEGQLIEVGRAKWSIAECDIHGCPGQDAIPQLFTKSAGDLWDKASDEANANLDPVTQAGDVLFVAHSKIVAGGLTQAMRDPDGLSIGVPGGTPFLASGSDWAPQSIAQTNLCWGRMSGSPLFFVTDKGAFVVGSDWTSGVAEDLTPILAQVQQDWTRAFGRVVTQAQADGGAPVLALEETAPFGYSSALSYAEGDLSVLLTNEATGPDATSRAALQAFYASAADDGNSVP